MTTGILNAEKVLKKIWPPDDHLDRGRRFLRERRPESPEILGRATGLGTGIPQPISSQAKKGGAIETPPDAWPTIEYGISWSQSCHGLRRLAPERG
jgi:hypothetical protein